MPLKSTCIVSISLFLLINTSCSSNSEIVYVDENEILNRFPDTQRLVDLKEILHKKKVDVATVYSHHLDSLKNLIASSNTQRDLIAYNDVRKERETTMDSINNRHNSILAESENSIIDSVNLYTKHFASANDYKLVLTNVDGNVLFVDSALDVTAQAIKFNSNFYSKRNPE